MIAQRVFAILAAALLVAAVAIATFGSDTISLGQAIYLLEPTMLDRLPDWSNRALGHWAWVSVLQPLLVRPAWLLPASFGVISGGVSLSLSNRNPHRSHRRS